MRRKNSRIMMLVLMGVLFLSVPSIYAETAKEYCKAGWAYDDKGDYATAISNFNKAIALNPDYGDAYIARGYVFAQKNNFDQAFLDLNKAIAIDPNSSIAYHNRACLYLKKNAPDKAIPDLDKAIELNPNYNEAYDHRGIAYGEKHNFDQAILDFSKAIEIYPKDSLAYNNRAMVYQKKFKFDDAIADYNEAIKISPNYAEAYEYRGAVYYFKAVGHEHSFEYSPEDYNNKNGPDFIKHEDLDQAISDFNKSIELDPRFAGTYMYRAKAYLLRKDFGKSWEDLHKAESLGSKIDPVFLSELKNASGREK